MAAALGPGEGRLADGVGKMDADLVEEADHVPGIVRRLESMGENEIPANVIGELVMQALASLDKVAYVRFASVYKNFRETRDFEALIGELEGDDRDGA